jgi:GTP cyclohydrolase I
MKVNGNNALRISEPSSFRELKVFERFESSDKHFSDSLDSTFVGKAFDTDDNDKIETISFHFRKIMESMGLDMTDDSLKGTPNRVAKMFVKEIFYGLNPKNKPVITLFENKYAYNEMLIERNIKVHSYCEHHFVPIIGKAHVAYIPTDKVIGLSKINRIVDYYARRPQVQERLTVQIAEELKESLKTEDVAVMIDSAHMCVITRGIQDVNSTTLSSSFHGKFKDPLMRQEFLNQVNIK